MCLLLAQPRAGSFHAEGQVCACFFDMPCGRIGFMACYMLLIPAVIADDGKNNDENGIEDDDDEYQKEFCFRALLPQAVHHTHHIFVILCPTGICACSSSRDPSHLRISFMLAFFISSIASPAST